MNKKLTLVIAGLVAGTTLFAAPLSRNFTPTKGRSLFKEQPGIFVETKDSTTLKGIKGGKLWTMFDAKGIKSETGKTICITFKASGKGAVNAGYYGYVKGYSLAKTESKPLKLADKAADFKLEFPLVPNVKIVRPKFDVFPDAEITISDFKVEIK
ncbi:MAG: hypothetical protein IKB25_04210 [Lentisphaeria bacterium]|nr:hypothetical protein [Lentisphaeria bacterium]